MIHKQIIYIIHQTWLTTVFKITINLQNVLYSFACEIDT